MRAIAMDNYGGKEVLQWREMPVPAADENELLIRVEAAGVGVWDVLEREGFLKEMAPAAFPRIIGADGSGTVADAGKDVRDFKENDKVYGYSFLNRKGGFYAEYVVLPEEQISHVPDGISMIQAGALAVPGLTALHGLHSALELQAGQRMLVFGVGSVGHSAVQLAKRLKAHVFAVASGDDGVALARAAGADYAFNGKGDEDLAGAIHEFAPGGLDGVLATANGKGLDSAIGAIRSGGRLAYPTGVQPEPKARSGVDVKVFNGTPDREMYDLLNSLIEAGPFEVQVDETFRLQDAVRAQEAMEKHHLGRMVLLAGS